MNYPKISRLSTYRVAENRIRIEWDGTIPDVPIINKFLIFRKYVWENKFSLIGETSDTFFDDIVDVDWRKGLTIQYIVGYESGVDSDNLLINGNFENWETRVPFSNLFPEDWNVELSETATTFQESSNVVCGSYSLGINNNVGDWAKVYQKVNLESPGIYKFSAYFLKDSSVESLLFRIYDSHNNILFSENVSDLTFTEHNVYLFVESPDIIRIEFYVSNSSNSGNYYIDCARLLKVGSFSEVSQITIEPQARAGLNSYLTRVLKEEVRRNTEIYYPNFAEEFVLLSRKYSGQRCSLCWDDDLMQATNPYCDLCFGTGYAGGYNKYTLKGQFQYPTEAYMSEPQDVGEWWTGRMIELIAEPKIPIRSRDIVVRKDGTRWMVGRIQYSRIAGAIIHQTATLYLIDTNHIAYRIPAEPEPVPWLYGWKYRDTYIIENMTSNYVFGAVIKIELDSSNFDFSKIKSDASDIRIIDEDNNQLKHYVEEFSSSKYIVYFRVPGLYPNERKKVYLFYGNPSAVNVEEPESVFDDYINFENPITYSGIAYDENEPYLILDTSDGTGQATHSTVLYFKDGWNGYKYWMAVTPYPAEDPTTETPELFVSNDGVNWTTPGNFTNPLVPLEPYGTWHSDPHLLYNPDTNAIMCFWRRTNDDKEFDELYVKRSSDGILWTPDEKLEIDFQIYNNISPSVVYKNGKYTMWVVNTEGRGWQATSTSIDMYETTDPHAVSGWKYIGKANLNLKIWNIWHQEVKYYDDKYWMLAAVYHKSEPDADTLNMCLILGYSYDGINWSFYEHMPLSFGRFKITTGEETGFWEYNYRSSFIINESDEMELYLAYYRKYPTPSETRIARPKPRKFKDVIDSLTYAESFHFWMRYVGGFDRDSTVAKKGNYSGKLYLIDPTDLSIYAKRFFPFRGEPMNVQIWFYDPVDFDTPSMVNILILFRILGYRGFYSTWYEWGIGINPDYSTTNYVWAKNWPEYNVSPITRTNGWHKFEIKIDGSKFEYYIDDQKVGEYDDWPYEGIASELYIDGESSEDNAYCHWDEYKVFKAYQDFGYINVKKVE